MTARTDELLAQLVELQRRQLAAQEAAIANQRLMLERQQRIVRRGIPLILGFMALALYGPYLVQLARYYAQR